MDLICEQMEGQCPCDFAECDRAVPVRFDVAGSLTSIGVITQPFATDGGPDLPLAVSSMDPGLWSPSLVKDIWHSLTTVVYY